MSSISDQNDSDITILKVKDPEELTRDNKSLFEKSDSEKGQHQQENEELENDVFPDVSRRMTLEERAKDLEIGLQWIRKELSEMKEQDRILTKEVGGLKKKVQLISDIVEPDEKDNDKQAGTSE